MLWTEKWSSVFRGNGNVKEVWSAFLNVINRTVSDCTARVVKHMD